MNRTGIFLPSEGTLVLASVKKNRKSTKRKIRLVYKENLSWPSRMLLLWQHVMVAVPCYWKKNGSLVSSDGFREIEASELFFVCADEKELDAATKTMGDVSLGTVPADSFLLTIAQEYVAELPASFVAIYYSQSFYCIGLIIDKRLIVSYRGGSALPETLKGTVGRLQRYFFIQNGERSFPETIVIIGAQQNFPVDQFSGPVHCIPLEEGLEGNLQALQAVGAALVQKNNGGILLQGPTRAARYRKFRLTGAIITFAMLAFLFLSTFISVGWFLLSQRRADAARSWIDSIIVNTAPLAAPLEESRLLAQSTIASRAIWMGRSRWAEVLKAISVACPQTAFVEKIAANSNSGQNLLEIAIFGQAAGSNVVGEYVQRLERLKTFSKISLTGLDNAPGSSERSSFTIVCVMKR